MRGLNFTVSVRCSDPGRFSAPDNNGLCSRYPSVWGGEWEGPGIANRSILPRSEAASMLRFAIERLWVAVGNPFVYLDYSGQWFTMLVEKLNPPVRVSLINQLAILSLVGFEICAISSRWTAAGSF